MEKEDSISDIFVDIFKDVPTEKELQNIITLIPNDIMKIGYKWGYSDTVFRDEVYLYLKNNVLVEKE